jgi:uncharacterized protein YpbB
VALSFSEALFLYCFKKIKDERTIYSLFHLFQGKKSSQTIQDAHLYNLTPFFQAFPFLTRQELESKVISLQNKGLLIQKAPEHFTLSDKGERELSLFVAGRPMPPRYLDGWKYHHLTSLFWQRLSLLVQVASNLVHQKRQFIPVQNKQETLDWVKDYIRRQNLSREELGHGIFKELSRCLIKCEGEPAVLVRRLTGHDKIGLTSIQTADELEMEHVHYVLEFLNILHFILHKAVETPGCFPLLEGIIRDIEKPVPFTLSTEKTYQLIKKGYTPGQIAQVRNLKLSTIEDHIVEIALHLKDFDLEAYVPKSKQERILQAAQNTSAKKLKQIRDQVADANYFEIRLVMAKNGDKS